MQVIWKKAGSLLPPLIMVVAFLCLGCTNFFGKQSSSNASASLVVSFSAPSAKTVTASSSDLLSAVSTLAIAVVNSSGTAVAEGTVAYSSGTTKTFGSLVAATYTVKVDASDASGNLIATGTQTVAMAGDTSVTVNLSFSQTSTVTTGGFSLNIAWPVSTSLPYMYAKLDSATASNLFSATGTVSSSNYTATIAKSGLSSGSHLLYIYFAASSSATTYLGPYIETVNIWDGVTSTSWLDGSGDCLSQRSFAASDFASSNANLEGLSISGATLSPSFDAGTTSYSLSSGFSGTSFSFTATTVSGTQNVTYTWTNTTGTTQSWTNVSGDVFTATSLACVSGTNTLTITVTAPDKQTTKTYTVNVNCGAAGVSIANQTTPSQVVSFVASSGSVTQNAIFSLTTTNSTLAAITSGWSWYVDGVLRAQDTSSTFCLSPQETSTMLGSYAVMGSVYYNGYTYSGRYALTVNVRSSLSLSGYVSTLVPNGTLSTPVAATTDGTNIYVADHFNDVIRKIDQSGNVTTLAGTVGSAGHLDGSASSALFNGPNGIALAGSNLYVTETNGVNDIRQISLLTGNVSTFVANAAGSFYNLAGITTDGQYLYVADYDNSVIKKIDIQSSAVTTLNLSIANFKPWGITTDGTYLYSSTNYSSNTIYRISLSTGTATTIATPTTVASCSNPGGLATDGANLYVADMGANLIWQISLATDAMTILAGSPTYAAGSSDALIGPGSSAGFHEPRDIVVCGSTLFVVDGLNNEIREIK